eukprot:TRINITY_DN5990_c0_g1_i2.p1 TRINITY_DN5990_c0_g1~~TRINITY_DN5990_c0_g1_i2.p1  ORF type:complete len:361 (+),score=80.96 TRINITY_DN5990_c0_g1_i2:87-1169(+)
MCSTETTEDKLVKNHHFDSLLQKLLQEKELASKRYVNSIMAAAKHNDQKMEDGAAVNVSPIEAVFQKHVRRTLMAYEDYFKDLLQRFTRQKGELTTQYQSKLDEIQAQINVELKLSGLLEEDGGLPAAPPLSRTPSQETAYANAQNLSAQYHQELAALKQRHEHSVQLLVDAYDNYMGSSVPSPFLLPVSVLIRVKSRERAFEASLKSTDTLRDCRQIIMDRMRELNEAIATFGPDCRFFLKRAAGDEKEEVKLELVENENLAVVELRLKPGTEIILDGTVQLVSEAVQSCFSTMYEKGKEQRMDYYKCNNCALNWICKSCAEVCHAGHDLSVFMRGHKPTYGCCYCAKKKKCQLLVKKK